jgi:kumamolisin
MARSVLLPGSNHGVARGARRLGAADPDSGLEVTVILRPRSPLPSGAAEQLGQMPLDQRRYMSRSAFLRRHGGDPADVEAVAAFARTAGLEVAGADAALRRVALRGSVGAMSEAFGTRLSLYRHPKGQHRAPCEYRGRSGALYVPHPLLPVIRSVHGLDERPLGRPSLQICRPAAASGSAEPARTPPLVAQLYNFPTGVDGTGERIAIIELGGGYSSAELRAYFAGLGVTSVPKITAVSVNGARNEPGHNPTSDQEVMLDIEIAGAIAPGAELRVYFARMTEREWIDAVRMAVFDERQPSVISISWVEPEFQFPRAARLAMDEAFQAAAMLGITVCCAAGDHGSSDGVKGKRAHVSYPASSPFALACGGTRLNGSAGNIGETVWNDGGDGNATGGGVSEYYPVPAWQLNARVPPSVNPGGYRGRGVPDVAGNADPRSPYAVRTTNGDLVGIGGTSAVAPLWAALVALLNGRLGQRVGYVNPLLYDGIAPAGFRDVSTGNNGAYRARRGSWDPCTGHGTPIGAQLVAALSGPSPTPTPSRTGSGPLPA